ncbi:MAG TPA: hypothetical protein VGG90_06215 [Candidatus Dormibacteraeota bacterium]|jgi:photosystem II stability/assembly factor-like uncharacterized protein
MFGKTGWSVTYTPDGTIGHLLRTSDGGLTWQGMPVPMPTGMFVGGFALIDASHAWLLAADQSTPQVLTLFATVDGGHTWDKTTAASSGVVPQHAVLTFVDPSDGWLMMPGQPASQEMQQGVVIDRTADGGKSWRVAAQVTFAPDVNTAGAPSASCGKGDMSFANAHMGWLTGGCTGGITFDVTTDGGVSWRSEPLVLPGGKNPTVECSGGPCTLTAPHFITSTYAYMVLHDTSPDGAGSWLYVSGDGGQNWTIRSLPGQDTRVQMFTPTSGFAGVGSVASGAAWLYRTDDGGVSWHPIGTNISLSYPLLDCVSGSQCWVVSPVGDGYDPMMRLYETTDGGHTWTPRPIAS